MASYEDIKTAALRLFAVRGYEGTSMKDIAQAVGLKKQSLYSHISGKEELFLAVLREQSKIIMSELDITIERLKNEPAEELLKGLFQSIIIIFSSRERLLLWKRTFIYFGSNETSLVNSQFDWHFDRKIRDQLYNVFQKHHKLAQPLHFRSFFLSYMLTVQGYMDWMIVVGHKDEVFQTLWSNFWTGVNPFFE
jgi:AcrR family transcriptional regulator